MKKSKQIVLSSFIMGAMLFGAMIVAPALFSSADVLAQRADDGVGTSPGEGSAQAWYAKFDGIDGESKDEGHKGWIVIDSFSLGYHQPGAKGTGQSRRRGAAVVEDLSLSMEYDKASPKLAEASLTGKVIPKLEIELTQSVGGKSVTYLKYEIKNVMVTSYQVNGNSGEGKPQVNVSVNFEEIKVTYTEYNDTGNKKSESSYSWKVEEGKAR